MSSDFLIVKVGLDPIIPGTLRRGGKRSRSIAFMPALDSDGSAKTMDRKVKVIPTRTLMPAWPEFTIVSPYNFSFLGPLIDLVFTKKMVWKMIKLRRTSSSSLDGVVVSKQ
jgi:hypothetical protein